VNNMLLDRIVVITGASSGIGAVAARLFAEAGAIVVITARSKEKLEAIAAEYPGRVRAMSLDVTHEEQVRDTFERIYETFGRVDVLVNNAGFGLFQSVADASMNTFSDMMEVNYFGVVRCVKAVLPRMIAQGTGAIVNVASVAGVIGTAKSAGYSATKHAVLGFTSALRQELHGTGVHVASVNPGPVDTPFFDTADPGGGYKKSVGRMMVTPEKVAKKIVDTVVHRRAESFVPGYMGIGSALIRLLPAGLFTRLAARFLNLK
jgi:uncharacterized protein